MRALTESRLSLSAVPTAARALLLCATLLLCAQAARAQMAYTALPSDSRGLAVSGNSAEEPSPLYAGSAFGAGADAALGYRFSRHLTGSLASGQFLFAEDGEIKPGIGINYARMLGASNWGVEVRGFAHIGFGSGLFPGAQAGLFRRTSLTERFTLFPQLSVFTYGAGIARSGDLFRQRWLRDNGRAGVMLEAPLAFELTEDKHLIATPMVRFEHGGLLGNRRGFGLTLGYDW